MIVPDGRIRMHAGTVQPVRATGALKPPEEAGANSGCLQCTCISASRKLHFLFQFVNESHVDHRVVAYWFLEDSCLSNDCFTRGPRLLRDKAVSAVKSVAE